MWRRICIVQVQPRKYVIDDTDYAAPTRQRQRASNLLALKRPDHEVGTQIDQESAVPALKYLDHEVGIDYRPRREMF